MKPAEQPTRFSHELCRARFEFAGICTQAPSVQLTLGVTRRRQRNDACSLALCVSTTAHTSCCAQSSLNLQPMKLKPGFPTIAIFRNLAINGENRCRQIKSKPQNETLQKQTLSPVSLKLATRAFTVRLHASQVTLQISMRKMPPQIQRAKQTYHAYCKYSKYTDVHKRFHAQAWPHAESRAPEMFCARAFLCGEACL